MDQSLTLTRSNSRQAFKQKISSRNSNLGMINHTSPHSFIKGNTTNCGNNLVKQRENLLNKYNENDENDENINEK